MVVGRGGVEPPTFHFSGGRSYQLSYLPSPGSRGNRGETVPDGSPTQETEARGALRLGDQGRESTQGEVMVTSPWCFVLATPTGLEPAASAVTGRRANQLRYGASMLQPAGVSCSVLRSHGMLTHHCPSIEIRTPNGIRTRATAVKGRGPGPLDDGGPPPVRLGRATANSVGESCSLTRAGRTSGSDSSRPASSSVPTAASSARTRASACAGRAAARASRPVAVRVLRVLRCARSGRLTRSRGRAAPRRRCRSGARSRARR